MDVISELRCSVALVQLFQPVHVHGKCLIRWWVWLSTDEEYVRKQLRQTDHENGESLKSLRWDAAVLRKVWSLSVSLCCFYWQRHVISGVAFMQFYVLSVYFTFIIFLCFRGLYCNGDVMFLACPSRVLFCSVPLMFLSLARILNGFDFDEICGR